MTYNTKTQFSGSVNADASYEFTEALRLWTLGAKLQTAIERAEYRQLDSLHKMLLIRNGLLANLVALCRQNKMMDSRPAILALITYLSDNGDFICTLTIKRIAQIISRSERKVRDSIIWLKDKGVIGVNETENGLPNSYWPRISPAMVNAHASVVWFADAFSASTRPVGRPKKTPDADVQGICDDDVKTTDVYVQGISEKPRTPTDKTPDVYAHSTSLTYFTVEEEDKHIACEPDKNCKELAPSAGGCEIDVAELGAQLYEIEEAVRRRTGRPTSIEKMPAKLLNTEKQIVRDLHRYARRYDAELVQHVYSEVLSELGGRELEAKDTCAVQRYIHTTVEGRLSDATVKAKIAEAAIAAAQGSAAIKLEADRVAAELKLGTLKKVLQKTEGRSDERATASKAQADRFNEDLQKVASVYGEWVSGAMANSIIDDVPGATKAQVTKALIDASGEKASVFKAGTTGWLAASEFEKVSVKLILEWVTNAVWKLVAYAKHGEPEQLFGGEIFASRDMCAVSVASVEKLKAEYGQSQYLEEYAMRNYLFEMSQRTKWSDYGPALRDKIIEELTAKIEASKESAIKWREEQRAEAEIADRANSMRSDMWEYESACNWQSIQEWIVEFLRSHIGATIDDVKNFVEGKVYC